jgi:hypothetical protein
VSDIEIRVVTKRMELVGVPLGTRIATNTNHIFTLEEAWGREYWIEEGTLKPFYSPLAEWLPAYILPPVVEDGPSIYERLKATEPEL